MYPILKTPARAWVQAGGWALSAGCALVVTILFAIATPLSLFFSVPFVLWSVWRAVRLTRLGVALDGDTIVVRNRYRTRRVVVGEIDRIVVAGHPRFYGLLVTVVRHDGTTVIVDATGTGKTFDGAKPYMDEDRARRVAAKMNEACEFARRQPGAPFGNQYAPEGDWTHEGG